MNEESFVPPTTAAFCKFLDGVDQVWLLFSSVHLCETWRTWVEIMFMALTYQPTTINIP